MIKLDIDVNKIEKEHLRENDFGKFCDIILWPFRDGRRGNNDGIVKQSTRQKAPDGSFIKLDKILGNYSDLSNNPKHNLSNPTGGTAPETRQPSGDAGKDEMGW